ncbi:hypothetical protein, partial [Vibrio parahaemolyticus]|uniref:hypothetical protein n=1 Tax=Vibrio parahaemolyticus TaxID=670 RepID=UPI0032AFD19F
CRRTRTQTRTGFLGTWAVYAAFTIDTVYSVMHPTDEQLAKSVKGISEASASKIRAAIDEKIVQPWERENWTKEQVNEVRRK